MKQSNIKGVWYPGKLSPHLFYLHGKLSGMAVAIPRVLAQSQKWEAFDMRHSGEPGPGPILLGSYDDVGLAQERIEQVVAGNGAGV